MRDYKLKSGNILRVEQDSDPESPDNWGNEDMFLVYEHRDFTIRRKGFEPRDIFEYLEDCHEQVDNNKYDDYYIFLVYAYIHSGVSLSLGNDKYPFNDRFDVSTTGYILIKKNPKGDAFDIIVTEKEAKELAEGLIETWNQYLSGNIWGFKILKPIKTYTITEEDLNKISPNRTMDREAFINCCDINIEYEEIGSCWGFYTSDPKENGMLDNINDKLEDDR